MPHFGQELFISAQEQGELSSPEYRDALDLCRRMAVTEGLERAFQGLNLDLLCYPSNGPAWKIDHINGDRYTGGNSSIAAVSGYPSLSLPAGYLQGMPIGLTFTGRPWQDRQVLECGYSFERATELRVPPVL